MTLLSLLGPALAAAGATLLLACSHLGAPPVSVHAEIGPPYDLSEADALLGSELRSLRGHVAVQLRQDGRELYRYQAGDIDHDSRRRLASVTKTISAGVVLCLVDRGVVRLDERLGQALEGFEAAGVGAPSVLDAWSMRHGITAWRPYERIRRFDLEESVRRIRDTGSLEFEPGTALHYDGKGMQCVGLLCQERAQEPWEDLARELVLAPVGMASTDYGQLAPNPAIASGLRGSADDLMRYAQMLLDGGTVAGRRVLSEESVEVMFTNHTRGLRVDYTPWPESHPGYPMGQAPDYAFGAWVLSEDRSSGYVEEIVGAGAWGSFLWIDRRRGLSAVLVTDVRFGSLRSLDAALGLFDIARHAVDTQQVTGLEVRREASQAKLSWSAPGGADRVRVYGSEEPLRGLRDLRSMEPIEVTSSDSARVPLLPHYAVTAVFGEHENTALIRGVNTL